MTKYKYYVVWEGLAPGIYDSWEECRQQVENVKGAKYKSFDSREAAIKAFRGKPEEHIGLLKQIAGHADQKNETVKQAGQAKLPAAVIPDSLAVDAACSGNPGDMEYRGVYTATGEEIFRMGPMPQGTNNIGEFLAIVHGLALMKQRNICIPLYSDSRNALAWVRQKKCKTQLVETPVNAPIFELIRRAEKWLQINAYSNLLLKWETKEWGEIPADFGRK